jgi:streptogramin lyase
MQKLTRTAMAAVGLGILAVAGDTTRAQSQSLRASLAGRVTADRGEVRALRVKARDTGRKVTYTVFTSKGRYQFYNLPAGTYDLRVLEDNLDSPVQTVELKAADTRTVDLAVKARAVVAEGAGSAAAVSQEDYQGGSTSNRARGPVELVDFDTLYPPSPVRDRMAKVCFGCHGPSGWHNLTGRSESEWKRRVNRMFDPAGKVAYMEPGVPVVSRDAMSAEEQAEVVKYLVANFGPGTKRRDLKLDQVVRDEDALAQVLYVEYEVPPIPEGLKYANEAPYRRMHDIAPSRAQRGLVWISGNHSGSIVSVDTSKPELTMEQRTREVFIKNPGNLNVTPHGIIEEQGSVYWAELSGDRIGKLDPKSGQIERFRLPTEGGGPHTLQADSKGNIFYTYFAETNKLGRVDMKTKVATEIDVPVKSWTGYGMIVDKKDRVWMSGLSQPVVPMYDTAAKTWTVFKVSYPTRRPIADSKGRVWVAEYFGNMIGMIDPSTGEVKEYTMPLKYGNPYEIRSDEEDNLWIDNGTYNSLVKFDQKTKTFTYVPFPGLRMHTPKMELDPFEKGTIWCVLGAPSQLVAFRPKGNVPGRLADSGR